jgi:hypothetical protein
MYWTAYSEYQLKKFDICKQTIDKMLKAYAKTSWKQDAELLLAQLPGAISPSAMAPSGDDCRRGCDELRCDRDSLRTQRSPQMLIRQLIRHLIRHWLNCRVEPWRYLPKRRSE